MKLTDMGEDRLVSLLTKGLPREATVEVGVGDDCAVVARNAKEWTLLKTDAVVEGVHFTRESDLKRVGWKAMARAVSDIASMGGLPEHALVTVAFSPSFESEKAEALYAGLKRCARKFQISIVGGETVRSPDQVEGRPGPLFLSIALTGRVEKRRCVLRSGGRAGDLLYVTGHLGGSIAGKHLDFTPRLEEARWLTEHFKLRAMMDLSDGLGSDLPRLAAASGCGFELNEALPITPGCTREQALSDGEDFELLFAIDPKEADALEKGWPFRKLPLTPIGRLVSKATQRKRLPKHGFDHFTKS